MTTAPRMDRARIKKELVHPDDDTTVYTVTVDGEIAGVIQSWEEDDPEYRHACMDIAIVSLLRKNYARARPFAMALR